MDAEMDEQTVPTEALPISRPHGSRDWLGSLIGLAVFLGGIALLVLVFRMAYEMFRVPPRVALGIQPGKQMDLNKTGDSVVAIVVRFVTLLLMAGTGSLVANRGISMYWRSKGHSK